MRVFEALATTLRGLEIRTGFGVLGEGNLHVIEEWHTVHGGRWVPATREDGGVLMAGGYAQVSGGIGFCSVTHGPGLTNTITALVETARARVPLLVLAGATDPIDRRNLQTIDQAALVAATGAGFHPVRSPATAAEDMVLAARRCLRERRPVVLNVPAQWLEAESREPDSRAVDAVALPRSLVTPSADAVEAAAAIIAEARRPVVLAGRGAVASSARGALEALADDIGALLCTSLLGRSLFRGHPFDIGVCGGFTSRLAQRLIGDADCVIAVGASLNGWTTRTGTMFPHASLVHCDVDPAAFGDWVQPDAVVVGDARLCADALREALRDGSPGRRGYRSEEVAALIASHDLASEFTDASSAAGLDLRAVLRAMDAAMPADRVVVVDGGHFTSEACRLVAVQSPRDFVFPLYFGSVGLGLGTAIGASVGRQRQTTLAVIGDGGLAMSLNELETAVRLSLPLCVLVMNDGAYGAEYHNLRALGLPPDLALFERPDYAAVARALGAEGVTVSTREDLDGLSQTLGQARLPLLVDAKLDPRVMSDFYGSADVGVLQAVTA